MAPGSARPPLFVRNWLPALPALVARIPAIVVTARVGVGAGAAPAVGVIPELAVGVRMPDALASIHRSGLLERGEWC
ncbi:hypothetical protein [Gordonia oryzae]|uniref:hypothetical protein n=1 Tax=Gordonia oryzae TaxID=2487349 RepID=UPI001FEC37D0|nr:hypothetical protein [Gordonia oryzae]